MSKRLWVMTAFGGLLIALVATALIWHSLPSRLAPVLDPAKPHLSAATLFPDERSLPAFSLQSEGDALDNRSLAGHWTLLFFGYTSCPDVCPATLLLLKEFKSSLLKSGLVPPRVVMVSVDPNRDTPKVLKQYTSAFDPEFIGVTGSERVLLLLAETLGVHYRRQFQESGASYVVDHSAGIYLVTPRGRVRAAFMPPHDLQSMLHDYAALTAAD
mgnify:FL=1